MSVHVVKSLIIFTLSAILFTGCSYINTEKGRQHGSTVSPAVNGKTNDITPSNKENGDRRDANSNNFIFPNSDKQLINDEELNNYDRFTLFLAKNEIFARRGYKFTDVTLSSYFNNTHWYKPLDNGTVNYNDLTSIEKKNFDLINLRYGSINTDYMSEVEHKETVKKDINFDGKDEVLTINFTSKDNFIKYDITVNSNGKNYSINGDCGISVTPKLYFADFSLNEGYIDFYIDYFAENDYPFTTIFRFDGTQIKKLIDLEGHIESYDGNKKIYTELNLTTDNNKIPISYYELGKGVVYPAKNKTVGKILQYKSKLFIFNDVKDTTGGNAEFMSLLADNDTSFRGNYKNGQVVTTTKPDEKLKIIDIGYEVNGNSSNLKVRNIPIKVQTEDGKQGWLVWINGGV